MYIASTSTAITENSGTTVAPLITTVVELAGTVNLIVVALTGVKLTVWPPAVMLLMPLIIFVGSVSCTSPALSNVIVTDWPSWIVAVVAFEVVEALVTGKLWPSAVFAVTVVAIGPPLVLPPAIFTMPTMFGCSSQKYG